MPPRKRDERTPSLEVPDDGSSGLRRSPRRRTATPAASSEASEPPPKKRARKDKKQAEETAEVEEEMEVSFEGGEEEQEGAATEEDGTQKGDEEASPANGSDAEEEPAQEEEPAKEEPPAKEGKEGEPAAEEAEKPGEAPGEQGEPGEAAEEQDELEGGQEESTAPAETPAETGEAKEDAAQEEPQVQPGKGVLELGHVYFIYRPKVSAEHAESLDDVQRMFMVLKPSKEGSACRLINLGKKKLPGTGAGRERFWAYVELVAPSMAELSAKVEAGQAGAARATKSEQRPVRPVGMGAYAIVDQGGGTHLAYSLQVPSEPGEVQDDFGIGKQGSFVLAVKNPERPAQGVGFGGNRNADFPPELQALFAGRRFVDANPPAFLDVPRAELVLIGASGQPKGEAQEALQGMVEEEEGEVEELKDEKVFQDLEMEKEKHPVEPLEGEWA
ncbi:hypothetical protein DFJ74DRAFT_731742 [Hyaloraphidium curvatum]|nr:hypothetical protein DFJ74DRAFT_731742 [Hyaloraphidium curvatum]